MKRNKAKATAILASIIWGATVLTGCPSPVETRSYPDTLSTTEETTIKNLDTSSLEASIASMNIIISILEKQDGVSNCKETIKMVRDLISEGIDGVVLPNMSDYEYDKIEIALKDVASFSSSDYKEDSYNNFKNLYETALASKTAYENYYIDEYKVSRNAYEAKESSVDVNSYKNTKAYENLVKFAASVVEDYKDNYFLNNTYNRDDIEAKVDAVKDEVSDEQKDLNALSKDYTLKAVEVKRKENQASSDAKTYATFELEKNDGTKEVVDDSYTDNTNPGGNSGDSGNNQGGNTDTKTTVEVASSSDISKITDWSKVSSVKVMNVVENDKTVNVLALRELYDAVVKEAGDDYKDLVTFGNYPSTVESFTLTLPSDKTNVDVMREYAPIGDLGFTAQGQTKTTELIPGVNITSYSKEYYSNPVNNVFQQAFEFTDEEKTNVVDISSSTEYNLEKSYQGGLIGEKLSFVNLEKANISGKVYFSDISQNLYGKFIEKQENLPTLNISSIENDVQEQNFYGHNIDLLIKKYYDLGVESKLSWPRGGYFNAKAYLNENTKKNGTTMYKENNYADSAYDLDINAFIVMGAQTENVNVKGNRSSSFSSDQLSLGSTMTNVRFESDMNGVSFTSSVYGVVDFEGDSPDLITPGGKEIVIFKKVSHKTLLGSLSVLDISELDQTSADNINRLTINSYAVELIVSASVFPTNFSGSKRDSSTYTYEEWEKAGNNNSAPYEVSSVLPKQMKAMNSSDLIRAILDDNQKVYS